MVMGDDNNNENDVLKLYAVQPPKSLGDVDIDY